MTAIAAYRPVPATRFARVHRAAAMYLVGMVTAGIGVAHSAGAGPATGEHYTEFAAEFKGLLDRLLAET